MKFAMISDLHGNLYAVEKTIEDIKSHGVDQIICLGDVATLGPEPKGVIQLLQSIHCPCIEGNHDEFMYSEKALKEYKTVPFIIDSVNATRESLSESDIEYLKGFKKNLEYTVGDKKVLFYHGTPESNTFNLLPDTPASVYDECFQNLNFNVFVGGHTHVQMMVPYKGNLVVNCGSVGLPFEEFVTGKEPVIMNRSEYATVELNKTGVHVEFHHILLDSKIIRESFVNWDNPLRPHRLRQYS